MKSEMCKKCIHMNVCFKDKNVCGDVFVAGNPMIFDNAELYRKYEERKARGFPCNDYFPVVVRCKDCKYYEETRPFSVIMTVCKYGDHTEWTEPNGYCHRAKRAKHEETT